MVSAILNPARADMAPPLHLLARESLSFAYMRLTASFGSIAPVAARGDGRNVMVIPGFMASDVTTQRLRSSLSAAGFVAHPWGLGRNKGVAADIFERIDARLDALALDGPVTLVGWSLGGLIAREYAKYAPRRVAKVITLGSPFSGDPRANNAWRLYEFMAGYKVDNPPIPMVLKEKPPVPTIAFWSAQDGVVASRSACGLPDESDEQHELDCTHMAFIAQPKAISMVAAAIIGSIT
jgi:pimeloyl-ACP methyl ester carboxylesterase